jgi:HlyD family secretion protein
VRQSIPRILMSLTALTTSATIASGCSDAPTAKADEAAGAAVTRVEVLRPERATIRRSIEEPGQIEAYEVTEIHAKVSGFVQKWNADIGAKVTKGQVLAVLSVPELDAEAEQKQALVEESEAKLAQATASEDVSQANLLSTRAKLEEVHAGIKRADADLARWKAEYHRIEELFNQRAQTGSLLDETRSKLKSSESAREEVEAQIHTADAAVRQGTALLEKARADVTAARASIKVARADARRVLALREYATIVAPYDGVITARHIDVGDLTEPGPHGQPLFIVVRDDVVRITVSVPEMYAPAVDPGDRVLIRLQALASTQFEGKVTRTSWTLDAKNRTLRTEIDVPNPRATLRPGLYAYATVIVEEHPDALTVPSTALVREDSRTFCIAVSDGRAVRRPVTLGLEDRSRAEILSGLQGDETIVKAYASSLVDGQAVQISQPTAK